MNARLLTAVLLCGAVPVADAGAPSSAFAAALVAESRSPEITDREDVYAKLLGTWDVEARDRTDSGTFQVIEGEWFFARTLEGRAVIELILSSQSPRDFSRRATPNLAADCLFQP